MKRLGFDLVDTRRLDGDPGVALLGGEDPLVGGKGGGKDDVAQGGGTDASRIDEALAAVATAVARAAGQG